MLLTWTVGALQQSQQQQAAVTVAGLGASSMSMVDNVVLMEAKTLERRGHELE